MTKKRIILPDHEFDGIPLGKLKTKAKQFYKTNIKGTTVVNIHKGITVQFNEAGIRHLIYARNIGFIKVKAVWLLKEMVRDATYCNFKEPDKEDSPGIIGYFNFKIKAVIENESHFFKVTVRLTKEGKFYYDHSVKVKK